MAENNESKALASASADAEKAYPFLNENAIDLSVQECCTDPVFPYSQVDEGEAPKVAATAFDKCARGVDKSEQDDDYVLENCGRFQLPRNLINEVEEEVFEVLRYLREGEIYSPSELCGHSLWESMNFRGKRLALYCLTEFCSDYPTLLRPVIRSQTEEMRFLCVPKASLLATESATQA